MFQEIKLKNIKIKYLGHSGWQVEINNLVFIFDYYVYKNSCYPDIDSNKKVYFFVSHNHPDHYDKAIYQFKNCNVKYIYGWKSCNELSLIPGSYLKIDDIGIYTHKSTDAGSGFLVKYADNVIYHAGDHADWEDNEPGISYKKEIDFVAKNSFKIDVAFLPAITFSGDCPDKMLNGILYAVNKLNPDNVFFMHAINKEYLLKEIRKRSGLSNVLIPEKPGDEFRLYQVK